MAEDGHVHGAGCSHGHSHSHDDSHDHSHSHDDDEVRIKNKDNLDVPAEADIDLDAMHPEVQIPIQQFPLTEQELRDDFMMLTEDGGIKKKILAESKEKELGSPPKNSKVICHYTGTLPANNDEKFDSSRDRNDPFSFKIGQGQVIKGWDIGIASMKKGERCILRCAAPYAYGANGSPPKIPGGATLDFDVELIEWDDWDECDGSDGGISKKIVIVSHETQDITSDDSVNMTYRIYYKGDDGSDQILCERNKYQMIVDDDDKFTKAFSIAIKSMVMGQKAIFKILNETLLNYSELYMDKSELKENEFNNNKMVAPAHKKTYYEIDIHEVVKPKQMWDCENSERIEQGETYKQKGNALFKQQRFLGAIKKYKKALEWVDIDFSDEVLGGKKKELVISTNNNLSLIYIKQSDWSAAIEHSDKVLAMDSENIKGLMRRGQARLQEGYLDLSKKDLKKALSLDESNSYIKKLLQIVTKKHKEYVEKQQKLYAGMFGGTKKKKKKKKQNKNPKNDTKQQEQQESKKDENEKENENDNKKETVVETNQTNEVSETANVETNQTNQTNEQNKMAVDQSKAVRI